MEEKTIEEKYQELLSKHKALLSNYTSLTSQHNKLEKKFEKVLESNKNLNDTVQTLYNDNKELQVKCESLRNIRAKYSLEYIIKKNKAIKKAKNTEKILDAITNALLSNADYIYMHYFEDKLECGWINQEEFDIIKTYLDKKEEERGQKQ